MAEQAKTSKPGEAALKNMKLLKVESSIFKVPKAPIKKAPARKSKVLDEEQYVQGIAKIIQRDFFPDLEKLNAQNEFLEASENKDYVRLRELTIKYSGNRPPTDPYSTPATFDTPGVDRPYTPLAPTVPEHPNTTADTVLGDPQAEDTTECRDLTGEHSLDSFLSRHTSEDNASYDRVIGLEERKRRAKVAAQLEAEHTAGALADAALALPSIEQQADQTQRPDEMDTWRYKAKNYIMYVPDGSGSQPELIKPELQHHNTRLHYDPFNQHKNRETISAIARSQDASVSGKIGVDGVCVGTEKPGVAYSYVGTPSPRPGDGPDQSPLMTWGEIEGTPFRLDGGDTPLPAAGAGAAYRMLESGARERIGLRLAEQAARRRRPTTPRIAPLTPSFRTNTERLASMSPAARKLAAKHLLSPRLKLTPANVGILSHSAATPKGTPSPRRRPLVATPSSNRKAATPQRTAGAAENLGVKDLTDNLLRINVAKRTRLKAQDFFKEK